MKRVDAFDKVTGRAIYADDMHLDRICHAAPRHAGVASARILAIRTDRARSMPGVIAIITAADVPGAKKVGGIIQDHYVFATDRVRYAGDVLALVAAETPEIARAAAALIEIDLEPLPALLSPRDALADGAMPMHEDHDGNVVSSFRVRHGDVNKGFRQSKTIVEQTFSTSFVEHAYLEPESCVAIPEDGRAVTIHGGMQHPFSTRRFVAAAMGLPLAFVRIVQTTLGGGFGGKDDTISLVCARAAIMAKKINRPVKITYTREESIRESYKRHPFELEYKAGIDSKGKFRAMEIDLTADSGPYCSTSPFVIWRPTVQCTGPYIVPNVRCDTRAVYTNNTFTGAMRGFGSPQHVFACESFMDICAEAAGLDPWEFRRRNFFKQNATTHTGQKLSKHKVAIVEVAKKALKEFGWKKKFALCSRGTPGPDGLLRGVGFACSYRGVSLGAEGNDFCSAIVRIQADGSALLEVGVSENGQGLKTAMVAILAGELGMSPERIRFIDTDTSSVPDSGPTVASRGTIVGGNAVIDAASKIKKMMRPVLEKLIGAPHPSPPPRGGRPALSEVEGVREGVEYVYKNGRISNPKTRRSISFFDAAAACHSAKVEPYAIGTWFGPKVSWDEPTGQGNAYFTYVYGCQACELTVDAKSGKVRVLRVVAAHEVGKAVNPQMAAGQIFGGIVMGLGFALMEEIRHEQGVIQNTNLNTYRMPRSTDAPEMTAILVENEDPAGPWGAKSLGEPTNELMGAAVANAVYYATNLRPRKTPIMLDDIRGAING